MKKHVIIMLLMTATNVVVYGQKQPKSLTDAKQISTIEFLNTFQLLADCAQYIVIDNNLVSAEESLTDWKNKNSKYFAKDTGQNAAECSGSEKTYISLVKFFKQGDYYKEDLAKWLHENGRYICFEATNSALECAHKIEDIKAQKFLEDCDIDSEMSIEDLKLLFTQKSSGASFDDVKISYDWYLNFELDWKNKVNFQLSETYKPTSDYYSIPFIRSIIKNNNITDFTTKRLKFIKISMTGKFPQVIMALKLNDGTLSFYNFSQIPPIGQEGYYFGFSPL